MRIGLVAASVAILVAGVAAAQTVPPPSPTKLFTGAAEIPALIAKARADRKGDQPLVVEPVLSLAPYRAFLEYRPGISPASVHEKDAEFMVVLEGTGSIVTGGVLVDEKRTNAANLSGTSISGGQSQTLVKGDTLIIPENTPHQILPSGDAPIILMSMHVPRPTPWP